MNKTQGILLIDPGWFGSFACNPDFIRRAKIVGQGIEVARIGSVRVPGGYAEAEFRLDGKLFRGGVRWAAGQAVADADCIAGPKALPYDRLTFRLAPNRAGASSTQLGLASRSGDAYAKYRLGGEEVLVRFELHRERSIATAPAARVVARSLGGTVDGPILREEVAYGVSRPVRHLTTRTDLAIGGLIVDDLYVRVADFGDAAHLRTSDPDELQPEDIVVTAKRGKVGGTKLLRIGRTVLVRCTSIAVERTRRIIDLVC